MKILETELKNYRNLEKKQINLDFSKILFVGKNAQGKTNILESIYFLSTLKSPRTSNIQEIPTFGEDNFEIKTKIKKTGVETGINYLYKEKKRELKINGLKTTPKNFKNILSAVLFTTQDLLLLRGSPQDRRDWLDEVISKIYPAYDERLSKYNKIRIQKNNFLKDYNGNQTLLDVYNEQLCILGSNIIFLRKKFLKDFEKLSQEKYKKISKDEKLTIFYTCSFLAEEEQIEEISQKFMQKLQERKTEEIQRGQALVGPHRDDVSFFINNKEAIKFASQGQQRTIVLSLKLAEIEIIEQKTGEKPVLLLDDVLAELDDLRQNYLLKTIDKNTQTIITSVDTLLFDKKFLKDVKIYKVEEGKIL